MIDALRPSLPDRRPGDRDRGQHRDRRGRRRSRAPGRAAAQRRRGDVHRQGQGQEPLRGLRADDANARSCASRAESRAARGRPARGARRRLPADRRPARRGRSSGSRRSSAGTTPTAAAAARTDFIPLAEETGTILAIGRLGAPRGVPRGGRLAARRIGAHRLARQPLGPPAPGAGLRRRGRRRSSRSRPGARHPSSSRSPRPPCSDDTQSTIPMLQSLRTLGVRDRRSTTSGPATRRSATCAASQSSTLKIDRSFIAEPVTNPEEWGGGKKKKKKNNII